MNQLPQEPSVSRHLNFNLLFIVFQYIDMALYMITFSIILIFIKYVL